MAEPATIQPQTHADTALWHPAANPRLGDTIRRFMAQCGLPDTTSYKTLHQWSLDNPATFWRQVWDFCNVRGHCAEPVYNTSTTLFGTHFFPNATLNFAENLLRRRDDAIALHFYGEDAVARHVSFAALYDAISQMRQALQQTGLQAGDRVAGILANTPEAIIAMLATTSLGAIWSSVSPENGVDYIQSRLLQINPRIVFGVDQYRHKGKFIDCRDKIKNIVAALPQPPLVVVHAYDGAVPQPSDFIAWPDFIAPYAASDTVFEQFPFNHPLYIMFSSGTTGTPKCIVHGAGGTLLKHLSEHQLHCGIQADDCIFYYTTTSWMMWNWLVTGLASGASLLLYDGMPFYPRRDYLFELAARHRVSLFGTSAKYIDICREHRITANKDYDLSALNAITTTGSPLSVQNFHYVYDGLVPAHTQLASISGGTDILGCFLLGNPLSPVYAGELQDAALGCAIAVYDETGKAAANGAGELVCTQPFPSMPVAFFNDDDGARYRAAYFETWGDDIWHHGDAVRQGKNGGYVIDGRSDATLNPSGVRIGTADIYNALQTIPHISDAVVVGRTQDMDEKIIVFVTLANNTMLDDVLRATITKTLTTAVNPHARPAHIFQVAAIPYTPNGKKSEMAVKNIVNNRPVTNRSALGNPECLAEYETLAASL